MTKLVLFLLKQYWKSKGFTWGIIFTVLATVSFTSVQSFLSKFIVDKIIADKNEQLLGLLFILLLAGYVFHLLCDVFKEFWLARLGVSMQNDVRLLMFGHLQKLPVSYFSNIGKGSLVSRFTNDLAALHTSFLSLVPAIHAILAITVFTVLNAWLHWSFALLTFAGVAVSFILPIYINKAALHHTDTLKNRQTVVLDLIQEHIAVQKTVRAFNLREWEYNRLQDTTNGLFSLAHKAAFTMKMIPVSVTLVLLFSNLIAVTAGAYLAMRGVISVGTLIAFQTMFLGVSQQVRELAKHIPALTSATASYIRIERLLNEKPEEDALAEASSNRLDRVDKDVSLNNVSFFYEAGKNIIEDLQLTVPAGSYAAIIGMNGSGKSTLVNLIMRFYEPTGGSVEFDGTDARHISAQALRDIIGYVSQDTELMHLSIMDNIRLGKSDVPDEAVINAAMKAGIHEWILSLPEGYGTNCGMNGHMLSGGQKQRIAIARALVRKPSILLLDEATSALDPDSERFINQMVYGLSGSKTVISVTHRLAAVQDADIIFLMDKGKLIRAGKHEELFENCELYRLLWSKQSGFALSGDGRSAQIDADRLKQIPLFGGLDDEFLQYLSGCLATEYIQPGETVVERGGEGDKFYIVARGKIEVLKRKADAAEDFRVAVLEDGDYFGEISLMMSLPRTASIRTLTPCTFLTIHRNLFQTMLDRAAPELRWRLEQSCRERLTY